MYGRVRVYKKVSITTSGANIGNQITDYFYVSRGLNIDIIVFSNGAKLTLTSNASESN